MSQELTEKVAAAIDAVQLWERHNDWTDDHVPGLPVEVCRYGKEGEPDIVVVKRFSIDDRHTALRETISSARARAAIAVVREAMAEPTPSMIAAAWAKIAPAKQAAGIARLGPGPGASEFYRAMLSASPLGEQ